MSGQVRKRARDAGGVTAGGVGRQRPAVPRAPQQGGPPTAYELKRRAMEQEEVVSDVESTLDDASFANTGGLRDGRHGRDELATVGLVGDQGAGASAANSNDDDPSETVEQKRLRLAREYLRNVGVDPDAIAQLSEDDDDDGGSDTAGLVSGRDANGVIARLQEDAARAAGRSVTEVAENIGKRYSLASGACVPVARTVRAHDIAPTCVALAGDEMRAASGGKDSRVIVWDVETGAKLASMRPAVYEPNFRTNPGAAPGHVGHVRAVSVADAQGGNIIASGGEDGLVRIWDARTGKQVDALRGHRGPVNALAFRSGTMQLFSGSEDRTVKIWDINDMAYVETLFGHGAEICGLDSLVKERALSCGRDGTLRLYKILDGSQLVFRRALTTSLDAVAMVNEQRFVSGGDDGAVALWHVNKKRPVSVAEHAHGHGTGCDTWISSVAAGHNTDLAVSGAGDGFVRMWMCEDRPPALRQVAKIDVGPGFVNGLALGASCRILLAVVGQEHRLGRWERKRGVKSGMRVVVLPHRE
jgi:ribosomal RNA-processing protein 9